MLNITKKYLSINKYNNQNELFEDAFLSHPNYPSLFALTDSLNFLAIENIALKVPKEQFVGLPDVFLAIQKDDFVLVKKEKSSVLIENDKGKKQNLSFNEFLDEWDQIIIAVEPNSSENDISNTKSFYKWLLYTLPLASLILLSVLSSSYNLGNFFLLGTSIIGLFLGSLILQEKIGVKTDIASKFCNLTAEASCDSVIKSETGKIFSWLGFTDLPILFFGINFFSLLLSSGQTGEMISILSLVSIPFLLYSIWIQKVKIKKWCLLCLAVSLVIALQGVVFLFDGLQFEVNFVTQISPYLISSILVFPAWMLLKPLIENEPKLKNELNKLKRFKRNFKIFQSLTKELQSEIELHKLKGIEFGNPNFSTNIILFLSPSCGHCHKAFEDAYKLHRKYPESVYLNVLFNVNPENDQNPFKVVVENLMLINSVNSEEAKDALIDWHINKVSLEVWKEKWKAPVYDMLVNNEIHNQYNWCLGNELNYTPVKIINSKLFPDTYEISDLQFFMNDFEEEFEFHYKKIAQ